MISHQGVLLKPKRNAKTFVKRCIGGVMTMMIKTRFNGGNGGTIKEKRRAPTMKSSWSKIGNEAPGGKPSRRLMKESNKSPINAPRERANPSNGLDGYKGYTIF